MSEESKLLELAWTRTRKETPPPQSVVETKIEDDHGTRNVQKAYWSGRMWWNSDGSMYLYYTPTHWRAL